MAVTREEILEKTNIIIHNCMPELEGVEITEDTIVNKDIGMDSMCFILVMCKVENQFGIKVPEREWKKISTMKELVDVIQKYCDAKEEAAAN